MDASAASEDSVNRSRETSQVTRKGIARNGGQSGPKPSVRNDGKERDALHDTQKHINQYDTLGSINLWASVRSTEQTFHNLPQLDDVIKSCETQKKTPI
jgi:hypothetical protein